MTAYNLASFILRKCANHFLVSNTGKLDERTDKVSFLLVVEERGYQVTVTPVELAS